MRRNGAKLRIEEMLKRDNEEMNAPSKTAAKADFLHVAQEYFEVTGSPELSVVCVKGKYEIRFSCEARRIKNFSTLK